MLQPPTMERPPVLTPAERTVKNMSGAQKAAAVIVALGAEKASLLYQHMDQEDVEVVTMEVARLGLVSSDATEIVLKEFYQNCLMNKAVTEGGMDYAKAVLEKAFGSASASAMLTKVGKSLQNRSFAFLSKARDRDLLSALQNERPQTIALVLSYISPEKAAGVVSQLEGRRQIRVVENLAMMDAASPAAVRLIESELAKKFDNIFVSSDNERMGGVDFVAAIMNNLDRASEKAIFDGLAISNDELADEIRQRMFVFEDIVTMDDRSVQRFLRDCDSRDLVLALKAANAEVSSKLFANMSSRMAESIRDDLEVTSNVRMSDVEEAQQKIVDVIRKLEEEGEIIILKGGGDQIIA